MFTDFKLLNCEQYQFRIKITSTHCLNLTCMSNMSVATWQYVHIVGRCGIISRASFAKEFIVCDCVELWFTVRT